jgi:hypothetical protein
MPEIKENRRKEQKTDHPRQQKMMN